MTAGTAAAFAGGRLGAGPLGALTGCTSPDALPTPAVVAASPLFGAVAIDCARQIGNTPPPADFAVVLGPRRSRRTYWSRWGCRTAATGRRRDWRSGPASRSTSSSRRRPPATRSSSGGVRGRRRAPVGARVRRHRLVRMGGRFTTDAPGCVPLIVCAEGREARTAVAVGKPCRPARATGRPGRQCSAAGSAVRG